MNIKCRYLLEEFKFLDQTRIAVWGWGYGGYVTTMVLGSQQKIFKCGIAVSPIADWQYYSKIIINRIVYFIPIRDKIEALLHKLTAGLEVVKWGRIESHYVISDNDTFCRRLI